MSVRPDLHIATHAYGGVPFEAQVGMSVQAENDGYDAIIYWDQANGWTPSSIFTPDITPLASQIPSLDVFYDGPTAISQAAVQAPNIKFWNGVLDSVRRPPFLQAMTALTLDHATKGRTVTILGSGEQKQMRAYGHKRLGAADKLWDTVHIMEKFFKSDDPVTYEGRKYSVDRALLALRPYGDQPPPVWIAGSGDEVFHLAGAVADGWVTYGPPGTEDDPDLFKSQVQAIHRKAREAGKDPADVAICMQVMTLVHPDAKVIDSLRDQPHVRWMSQMVLPTSNLYKKWGVGAHPMGEDWSYAVKMDRHFAMTKEEALDVCNRTPREAVDHVFYTGSPEEVANKLKPFLEHGVTDLLLMNVAPFTGAEDYLPQVQEIIRSFA